MGPNTLLICSRLQNSTWNIMVKFSFRQLYSDCNINAKSSNTLHFLLIFGHFLGMYTQANKLESSRKSNKRGPLSLIKAFFFPLLDSCYSNSSPSHFGLLIQPLALYLRSDSCSVKSILQWVMIRVVHSLVMSYKFDIPYFILKFLIQTCVMIPPR